MKVESINSDQQCEHDTWSARLLETEFKALQREQEHLKQKQRERVLSPWELQRFHALLEEIMQLLPKISNATYQLQSRMK